MDKNNNEEKQGFEIVKINTLSMEELSKLKIEDLWIFKPGEGEADPTVTRLCGCRNVCIA
ncbi:hypothetical protein V3851_02995 [Paenibacillus sp. M1]|uniref:Lantibiotic n=1 Tax=Paenibacillus haidiansis TaxID=1574488 RepID=A0ABU7VN40_9BACL